MTEADRGREAGTDDGSEEAFGERWVPGLVWLAGLLSTIYVVCWTSFLSFISLAFINYSTPDFEWRKVAEVALSSLPLLCSVALGIAGLRFWPRGRFRLWGLSAIGLQVAMAGWILANPDGLLTVTRWPF